MKTYIDFLKEEGVEEYTFTEGMENIDEEQFEYAAEAYHEYRMAQYKEQGLILLPDRLTAENGAKELLRGEFVEIIRTDDDIIRHYVSWDTIKDIYKKVVEHFTEEKWYCRKEVNKGIKCNIQCKACVEKCLLNIMNS